MNNIKLINDDCLKAMKDIPDGSVDLVLIDPPYNINKDKWDTWKTVDLYVSFLKDVFLELERVLKDNGSFYFFHNDFMQIVEIQNMINKETKFNFKSFINWYKPNFRALNWKNPSDKNNLRSWFNVSEYCLFYTFDDSTGRKKIDHDVNNYKTLREYSKSIQEYIGLKLHQITNKIGRKCEHFFYHSSSQFSLPTKETYEELTKEFKLRDFSGYKEYEELKLEYEDLRLEYEDLRLEYEDLRLEYEDLRYTFNLDKEHNNLWVSKDKRNNGNMHSCSKPIDLLERIIKCSSNENDTVLDCFMGSGSTGVACKNLNRNFIGIELDKDYFEIAKKRINGDSNDNNSL